MKNLPKAHQKAHKKHYRNTAKSTKGHRKSTGKHKKSRNEDHSPFLPIKLYLYLKDCFTIIHINKLLQTIHVLPKVYL